MSKHFAVDHFEDRAPVTGDKVQVRIPFAGSVWYGEVFGMMSEKLLSIEDETGQLVMVETQHCRVMALEEHDAQLG